MTAVDASTTFNGMQFVQDNIAYVRCFVCMNAFKKSDNATSFLTCGHVFCKKCIATKKTTVFKCWVCRQPSMVRVNPQSQDPAPVASNDNAQTEQPAASNVPSTSEQTTSRESESSLSSDSDGANSNLTECEYNFARNDFLAECVVKKNINVDCEKCSGHADLIKRFAAEQLDLRKSLRPYISYAYEIKNFFAHTARFLDPIALRTQQDLLRRLFIWVNLHEKRFPFLENAAQSQRSGVRRLVRNIRKQHVVQQQNPQPPPPYFEDPPVASAPLLGPSATLPGHGAPPCGSVSHGWHGQPYTVITQQQMIPPSHPYYRPHPSSMSTHSRHMQQTCYQVPGHPPMQGPHMMSHPMGYQPLPHS